MGARSRALNPKEALSAEQAAVEEAIAKLQALQRGKKARTTVRAS